MDSLTHKAVFLDRDGVVGPEKGPVCSPDQLEIYPFAGEAITKLKTAGWKIYIVTNQSGIARGLFTEEELQRIHTRLRKKIAVDEIYYCPHHPDGITGHSYSIECDCRKPQAGMIFRAAQENGIDLRGSFLLGDRPSDILAGKRAGLITVLLRSGYGFREDELTVKPDYIFADLITFAQYLVSLKQSSFPVRENNYSRNEG